MELYNLKNTAFFKEFTIIFIFIFIVMTFVLISNKEGAVEFDKVIVSISVDTAYKLKGNVPEGIDREGKLGGFRHCLQTSIDAKAPHRRYGGLKADNKVRNGRYYMWLSDQIIFQFNVYSDRIYSIKLVDDNYSPISPAQSVMCDIGLLNKGTDGDPEIKGGNYDKNAEEQFETVLASLSSETGYQFKYKKPEGVLSQGKLNSFSHCLKSYKTKRSINWVPEKGEYNQYKMWISDHVYLDLTTRDEEAYSLILRDEENKTYSSTYRLNCKLSLLGTN